MLSSVAQQHSNAQQHSQRRMQVQPHSTVGQEQPQPWLSLAQEEPKILIVEDSELQAIFLVRMLGKLGYNIFHAKSGNDALEMARQILPDLILMDLGLPDINGLDVSGQLSDDLNTSAIPIIAISASDNEGIVGAARRVGCQYFIRKPYDPDALLLLIQDALHPFLPCSLREGY